MSSTFGDLVPQREFIKIILEEMAVDALMFPEKSMAGEKTNAFLDYLEQTDVLIYVATQESEWVAKELQRAATLGIPVIELAQAQLDPSRGSSSVTDIAIRRRAASVRYQATFSNLDELRSAVRGGLSSIISRRFSLATTIQPLTESVYNRCEQYVRQTQEVLGAVQRTSSLILGPQIGRLAEEGRFVDALRDLIMQTDVNSPQLYYLFDHERTLSELRESPEMYPQARESCNWLRDALTSDRIRTGVKLKPVVEGLTPLVLQDSTLSLAAYLGSSLWYEQREAGRSASVALDALKNAASRPSKPSLGRVLDLADQILDAHEARGKVRCVSEEGEELDLVDRQDAHEFPGLRHLGFSAFVMNARGETLLQRRSSTKEAFPGLWSNACCSHHSSSDDLLRAASERLQYELGMSVDLTEIGAFSYDATCSETGHHERELNIVLVGTSSDSSVTPNASDVGSVSWISVEELVRRLDEDDRGYAPWLRRASGILRDYLTQV